MNELTWPWPSSYKWKYVVEEHSGRLCIADVIVDWAGNPTEHSMVVVDVGAESLQDLKQALGLMMKCVDKKIKEKTNV